MEDRPKIKLALTKADIVVEGVCLVLLIGMCVGTTAIYSTLPDQIPTHFNLNGQPDDYGHKASILTLPIVATVIYIGITILNKFPHIYNYPSAITVHNAERMYRSATKFIRLLKLTVLIIFATIIFTIYKSSLTADKVLDAWFIPFILVLILVPIIIYTVRTIRDRNKK